jgi:hypothetical protein
VDHSVEASKAIPLGGAVGVDLTRAVSTRMAPIDFTRRGDRLRLSFG